MQERIALEELNKDLSSAQSRLEKWAIAKVTSAMELKEQHFKLVDGHKGHIADLQAEQNTLAEQAELVSSRVSREQERENGLQSEIQDAEERAAETQDRLRALQLSVREETAKLKERETQIAAERTSAEKDLAVIHGALELFQKRLGLEFVQSNEIAEELRVVLTCIDPAAHDREFVVGVRVKPTQEYEVTTCKPPLEDVEELLAELNRSNDFGLFVLSVRNRFKHMCPQQ